MSLTHPPLTLAAVADHVRDVVFGVAGSPDLDEATARSSAGIELEWLTGYREGTSRVSQDLADAVVGDISPMAGGSRITIEPGGQLELSSARFDSLDAALASTGDDLYTLDQASAARRIELVALGADPVRDPERVLHAPRYDAMETFFDHDGRAGRTMMCNTASIQVNVGLGPVEHVAERWRVANAIGPLLIAVFANSPFAQGAPSGWQSTRLRAWWTLDPSRAAAPGIGDDPVNDWIDYALRARVMFIRSGDAYEPMTDGLTFGEWIEHGHPLGAPTMDDFAYHLTTLFPPVRPRGWFEVRVLDALPTPFWQVAVAVTHALITHTAAAADVLRAIDGSQGLWVDAAQLGLAHPVLGRCARTAMPLAAEILAETAEDAAIAELVAGYHDHWSSRGRSPADDRLDAWRRDGTSVPPRESPVPYGREVFTR